MSYLVFFANVQLYAISLIVIFYSLSKQQTNLTSASARDKPAMQGALPGEGLLPSELHFEKAFVELMLNSNWHVTLRLIVFEIFASNGQNLGPKFRIWVPPQNGEDLSGTDMYHHTKFHADWCHRRRDISNRTEKKQQLIQYILNVWRVISFLITEVKALAL